MSIKGPVERIGNSVKARIRQHQENNEGRAKNKKSDNFLKQAGSKAGKGGGASPKKKYIGVAGKRLGGKTLDEH